MCGFAGLTSSSMDTLEFMASTLRDRAIDKEYFYCDTDLSLYHAHLKISDLDKDTSQPYVHGHIIVWLVGEIYNKQFLLNHIGVHEDENIYTECQVISMAYEKLWTSFIDLVNGEFAIFIFDTKKETYFLFRDRWGTKTLYYRIFEGVLYFSSEIKSLAFDAINISKRGFIEHMIFQFSISPHTIVEGVYSLRPWTYLSFYRWDIQIENFWDYVYQEDYNTIVDTIESSIIRRLPLFQKKLFVSLSWWPDSNLILYFLKKHYTWDIIAYSFCTDQNQNDIDIAIKNAKIHNIEHILIDMNSYEPDPDPYVHEGLVLLPNIGKILKDACPHHTDTKVEFGWDGKEELILSNTHYPYQEIFARYKYFLNKWLIDALHIDQEFLNKEMFDYNLQMIDKITLRNGIERRLPFTDYELMRYFRYSTYRTDIELFLKQQGISIVQWEYGYNLWLKFAYLYDVDLKKRAIKFIDRLRHNSL